MSEKNLSGTSGKRADGRIRLRVDLSGLSEETRRELGLGGGESADKILRQGGEKKPSERSQAALSPAAIDPSRVTRRETGQKVAPTVSGRGGSATGSARAFPIEDSKAGRDERPERGGSSDVLEPHRSPVRTRDEGRRQREEGSWPNFRQQLGEGDQAGRAQGFDESGDARDQTGEKIFAGREGREGSPGSEHIDGTASPGAATGGELQDRKSGDELLGEGSQQSLAEGVTLPQPEVEAIHPEEAQALTGESRQPRLEISETGRREEAERWQALQAAVTQNLAHHQGTHAAVLEALRDSARLQAAQRAELDRLAAQVRRLLGQSANAGFNRQ